MDKKEEISNNLRNCSIAVEHPFKCSTPVQLRYTDLDTHGHVINSVYFNLFDLAKADYFGRVMGKPQDYHNVNVMIASIHCDYLAQTRFYEPVAIETQVTRLGSKSLTIVHQLVNTATGEVKCRCSQVLVYFDTTVRATAPVPQHWRDALEAFEGRKL